MYYCEDCGYMFDRPISIEFINYDQLGAFTEYTDGCPNCKCIDIAEAKQCEECGTWWEPSKINDDGICPMCVRDNLIEQYKRIEYPGKERKVC